MQTPLITLSAVGSQFAVGSKIVAEEGVGALYRGLSAGLLRQATYTTARLGIYQFISDELAKRHDGKVPAAAAAAVWLDMRPSAASHAARVVSRKPIDVVHRAIARGSVASMALSSISTRQVLLDRSRSWWSVIVSITGTNASGNYDSESTCVRASVMRCPQPIPLIEKAGAGLTAGGLGAMVGSPADLTLIRMQSDSTLPAAARRNYKGVGDALVRCPEPRCATGQEMNAGVPPLASTPSGIWLPRCSPASS